MSNLKYKSWAVRSKVWLEIEGVPILGDGRRKMLQAIHEYGSIIDAAKATGIAYRKIRGAIREMEIAIGEPLVKAYRGGEKGGGAMLTPIAHELIREFTAYSQGFKEETDLRFSNIYR